MAHEVKIKWPKGGGHEVNHRLIIATGRAIDTIVGVSGECRPSAGGAATLGTTHCYFLARQEPGQARFYRWMIHFALPAAGDYELVVTGYGPGGNVQAARPFKAVAPKNYVPPPADTITIISHFDGQDITDEKDDFFAYGTLVGQHLGVATMTAKTLSAAVLEPEGPVISEPVGFEFWGAWFPDLVSGETYDLHVENSAVSSADDVAGLIVL